MFLVNIILFVSSETRQYERNELIMLLLSKLLRILRNLTEKIKFRKCILKLFIVLQVSKNTSLKFMTVFT